MKVRTILASTMLAALMALGSAPAAYADDAKPVPTDNDTATSTGGLGGSGTLGAGVGVCGVNVAGGPAGCENNGFGDASGGDGGPAIAYADVDTDPKAKDTDPPDDEVAIAGGGNGGASDNGGAACAIADLDAPRPAGCEGV